MNKKNERFLAYSVAVAASFSVFPGAAYAATDVTAPAASAEASAQQPAEKAEAMQKPADAQAQNTAADARTQEWGKVRPQEKEIAEHMKSFEGQTIVDTAFEGTTKSTEATAKAAITMHTGDMFTVKGLNKDRDAIYNTGYFYDLYPTFEKVPEGVVITYHVLENPVLSSVKIVGNISARAVAYVLT